jgi:hypothetical protein
MAEFITGKKLADEVCDIVFNAKKKLLIVSPYIKLDDYFKKEVFNKHKNNPELEIIIVFGKNKYNPQKSFSKIDFEYFKEFPNISIVYVNNLHAKYYANEIKGVVTSINLYDYSFKNNIEFGVVSETKLIGGSKIDLQAWNSTMSILTDNHAVYVRKPKYKKKLIGKDYMSSEVQLDLTEDLLYGRNFKKYNVLDFLNETYSNEEQFKPRVSREEFESRNKRYKEHIDNCPIDVATNGKLVSATALGKLNGKSYKEVIEEMTGRGFLCNNEITPEGAKIGITYKENAKGDSWIVYPDFLAEAI